MSIIMYRIKVKKILTALNECYPDAKPALTFKNVFELLVAVILSAQCTDIRVNKVTDKLFEKYNKPEDFSKLTVAELEPIIRSCGLSKTKANGIIESSKIILNKYNGIVPSDIAILQTLPSVGRKTANVVASVGYGIPAIAVDTHVFRVSNRIGLANAKDVLKTELELQKNLPKKEWNKAHHLLIFHGRNVCKSQNPQCDCCKLNKYCKFYKEKYKSLKS